MTFPVDLRTCQIELAKYQSFSHGLDFDGNPIFNFFNMCKGIWRKDVDASLLATLHRFESAAIEFKKLNPDFKFTLIVVMGEPCSNEAFNDELGKKPGTQIHGDSSHDRGSASESHPVQRNESFHIHTNFQLAQNLIRILRENYPERLSKALIIPNGWEKVLGGLHGLRRYIPSDRTRSKIIILDELKNLLQYAAEEQLSTLVGGSMPVPRK